MPLIALLAAGISSFLTSPGVRVAIGLAGGIVLLMTGVQLLLPLRQDQPRNEAPVPGRPFMTGIALTGANPYFMVWWATVGLALATQAVGWGAWALLAFAAVHWFSDLGWLEVLSLAGFKGSQLFAVRGQKLVAVVCAIVLLGFAAKFMYDAGFDLLQITSQWRLSPLACRKTQGLAKTTLAGSHRPAATCRRYSVVPCQPAIPSTSHVTRALGSGTAGSDCK
jgi:threonine/homoserine/homoserine lactone efflux protein